MNFFDSLARVFDEIEAGGDIDGALSKAIRSIRSARKRGDRLIFIGNGGSAAIASHMAADWMKNGGMRTLCFNDPASLTCLSNDLGYEEVFALPLGRHMTGADLLIAISSSGRSPNILRACEVARRIAGAARLITLSGFDPANPLRTMGLLNFYVPSSDYGIVECAHLAICHAMINGALAQ